MAAMILFSSSVKGERTGEADVFLTVMLHVVPLIIDRINPFFNLRREIYAPVELPAAVKGLSSPDSCRSLGRHEGHGNL